MHGKPPALTGNEHPNLVPYAVFPARDGNIFMGVGNDGTFRKLMKELGRPELGTDPRFARNRDRIAHRDELRAVLVDILKDFDSEPPMPPPARRRTSGRSRARRQSLVQRAPRLAAM
jgi:formyl-CoA transferase